MATTEVSIVMSTPASTRTCPGVDPAQNELGSRMSLGELRALVEAEAR